MIDRISNASFLGKARLYHKKSTAEQISKFQTHEAKAGSIKNLNQILSTLREDTPSSDSYEVDFGASDKDIFIAVHKQNETGSLAETLTRQEYKTQSKMSAEEEKEGLQQIFQKAEEDLKKYLDSNSERIKKGKETDRIFNALG